ncbi:MAG: hypothetical protein IJ518_06285 [Clostridia bacterium]|nr:hypothetical protein [Clostridia bacterium]
MKKAHKLIAIAAAAAVWLCMAGTLFVYVIDDNGLFGSSVTKGEDVPVTDPDILDAMSSIVKGDGNQSTTISGTNDGGNTTTTGGNGVSDKQELSTLPDADDIIQAVADRVLIGNKDDESGHKLHLSGGAQKTSLVAATGTLSDTYPVIRFEGKGATATFKLNVADPEPADKKQPVLLQIKEIHEPTTQAFGYTVYVNNTPVYFRTYEQIASAPNSYFIAVDRAAIPCPKDVEVKIVNEANTTFHIAEVIAYTTFYELMESEKVYSKLGINFYNGINTTNALANIQNWPSDYNMYEIGIMLSLKYMNLNEKDAAATLKSYIEAAEQAGTRLQIMSAMYWSNSPYSPDGLGGNFSDLKYSQVLYNSALDLYSASTPNVYSNTQWVTTGSSVLNNAAVSKIKSFFSSFANSLSFLRARGKQTQPIDLVMEWGVCYKGFGTITGYEDFNTMDGADFHPELVEAAKKDGVTLDPKDGLSFKEKRWLTDWHAAYNQMLADAYILAMGHDAVQVSGNKIDLPNTQTIDHIFSHNVQWINQNPSWGDLTISGWQSGVGDGFYSSSEDMYFDPVRFYQYKAAYGRTGCVNVEMAIHNPKGVIQKFTKMAYQNGLEFLTLFNDKDEYNTAQNLRDIDKLENTAIDAPEHFDVNILDVDFNRDAADLPLKNPAKGVTYQNLKQVDGELKVNNASNPGVITLELKDGQPFDNGLYIDVYGKTGTTSNIQVLAGPDLNSLTDLGEGEYIHHNDRFNSNITTRYDFSAQSKGKSTYYVRIVFNSTCTVRGFKVMRPFAQTTGQLNGLTTTYKQARLQNLWISQQAITANQLEDYIEKNGGEDSITRLAVDLMNAGYYKTAYRLLAGEISQVLPAKYLVTGSGKLGRYPVSLSLKKDTDCVQITLTKVGKSEFAFSFVTEKKQTVTMEFTNIKNGQYELASVGENSFILKPSSKGTVTAKGGKATVEVSLVVPGAKKYTTVSGRAYANGGSSTIQLSVQDPTISNYSQYEQFMVSGSCEYTRRLDGSDQTTSTPPRAGDFVTLTFDSNNLVVKCESVYGEKTGVIKSFTPPSLSAKGSSNGIIEFADGTRFELDNQAKTTSIELNGPAFYARAKTAEQLAAIFTPGKEIRITYCPERYNGALPRLLTVSNP